MRQRLWITFCLILLLAAAALYTAWPKTTSIPYIASDIAPRLGLDLKGGVHLVYEADTSKVTGSVSDAMNGVRDVFDNRVNTLGVTEPDIRISSTDGKPSIIVDLPGVTDVDTAKQILGATAKLEFKDETGAVVLEGSDIIPDQTTAQPSQAATTSGLSNTNQWEVDMQLTSDGTTKFSQATSANIGKPISIYLDGNLISSPVVQQAITDGKAVITGNFTADQARNFALQLKSGALPVPVTLVQEQTVGASLGADAISSSVLAGVIGILLILIFMITYYRFCGILASIALIVYSALNIAVFKLFHVTLTLAGIAGFIISIGIAVDTNVLTFERLKEELRTGKPVPVAVMESFRRAWTSIRDSHIAGLISATVIFIFASGSVRGFALVLIIGTLLSLFSAITVTRNWMLLVAGSKLQKFLHL